MKKYTKPEIETLTISGTKFKNNGGCSFKQSGHGNVCVYDDGDGKSLCRDLNEWKKCSNKKYGDVNSES